MFDGRDAFVNDENYGNKREVKRINFIWQWVENLWI